jgi:hypothetical protein
MRLATAAFFAVLALGGCSPTFESLPRPTFFSTSGGNCTSTLAVDARGDRWTEHGCEARSSGVRHRGRLTASQQRAFLEALMAVERLPDRPTLGQPACSQPWERISLARVGVPDREWYVCPTNDGRRAAPFEAVFEAMR